MDNLAIKERELVALGAAIASNCVPCIERLVPQARKAGLTDPQIEQAVRLAERVRQIPAGKVLSVALQMLGRGEPAPALGPCAEAAHAVASDGRSGACCG